MYKLYNYIFTFPILFIITHARRIIQVHTAQYNYSYRCACANEVYIYTVFVCVCVHVTVCMCVEYNGDYRDPNLQNLFILL